MDFFNGFDGFNGFLILILIDFIDKDGSLTAQVPKKEKKPHIKGITYRDFDVSSLIFFL